VQSWVNKRKISQFFCPTAAGGPTVGAEEAPASGVTHIKEEQ